MVSHEIPVDIRYESRRVMQIQYQAVPDRKTKFGAPIQRHSRSRKRQCVHDHQVAQAIDTVADAFPSVGP
jgi:hypothetical protein